LPEDSFAKVEAVLKRIPEIIRYHDLRIRESGADNFIDVSVHLNSDLTNKQAHSICNKIEDEVKKVIKRADVFVHAEPEETDKF
jgi:divalent metal cation (Fe/Co/Zn/Cd) transporter